MLSIDQIMAQNAGHFEDVKRERAEHDRRKGEGLKAIASYIEPFSWKVERWNAKRAERAAERAERGERSARVEQSLERAARSFIELERVLRAQEAYREELMASRLCGCSLEDSYDNAHCAYASAMA